MISNDSADWASICTVLFYQVFQFNINNGFIIMEACYSIHLQKTNQTYFVFYKLFISNTNNLQTNYCRVTIKTNLTKI